LRPMSAHASRPTSLHHQAPRAWRTDRTQSRQHPATLDIGARMPSRAAARDPAADEEKPAIGASRTGRNHQSASVIARSAPLSRRNADSSTNLFSVGAARAHDRARPTNGSDRGCARSNLIRWSASWQRHPKVFAYLPCQVVVHLAVSRNSTASVQGRVMPPRVAAAFPKKRAAMRGKVSQEIATLHTAMLSSS
jgi:hypothetical protein